MRRAINLIAIMLLLLSSCTKPPPSPPPLPPGPERCQDGMPAPPAPRPPRTVEQLGAWALTAERAARQTEHARAVCAEAYMRLREWTGSTR